MNLVCFYLLLICCTANATNQEEFAVLFVVDGSMSIGIVNFDVVRQWLVNVSSALIDSSNKVLIEVLQYSATDNPFLGIPIAESKVFEIPFKFGECKNIACIRTGVTCMPYLSHTTFTHYALRRAREVEFKQAIVENATKIIVVITDGSATDAALLGQWHNEAVADNITVFAVGVGDGINEQELRTIANGGTSDERVSTVDRFEDLAAIILSLADDIGVQTYTASTPTIKQTTTSGESTTEATSSSTEEFTTEATSSSTIALKNCTEEFAVLFVVDGSLSIGIVNFDVVRQWLVNVSSALIDSSNKVLIEVLQYSATDIPFLGIPIAESEVFEIPFKFGECKNISCIRTGVTNMPYLSHTTFTHYALRRAREVEFKQAIVENATKIIVVITDGSATDPARLGQWHNEAVADNITVFAVGVGDGINEQELRTIANGGTSDERVSTVDRFEDLAAIILSLANEIGV